MKRVQQVWSKPEMRIQEVAEIITGAQLKWFKSDPVGLPGIMGSGLFIEYETIQHFPMAADFMTATLIKSTRGQGKSDRIGLACISTGKLGGTTLVGYYVSLQRSSKKFLGSPTKLTCE